LDDGGIGGGQEQPEIRSSGEGALDVEHQALQLQTICHSLRSSLPVRVEAAVPKWTPASCDS
jgi:hypothetical protein